VHSPSSSSSIHPYNLGPNQADGQTSLPPEEVLAEEGQKLARSVEEVGHVPQESLQDTQDTQDTMVMGPLQAYWSSSLPQANLAQMDQGAILLALVEEESLLSSS